MYNFCNVSITKLLTWKPYALSIMHLHSHSLEIDTLHFLHREKYAHCSLISLSERINIPLGLKGGWPAVELAWQTIISAFPAITLVCAYAWFSVYYNVLQFPPKRLCTSVLFRSFAYLTFSANSQAHLGDRRQPNTRHRIMLLLLANVTGCEAIIVCLHRNWLLVHCIHMERHAMYIYYALQYPCGQQRVHLWYGAQGSVSSHSQVWTYILHHSLTW